MNTVSLLAASWIRNVEGLIVLQGIFPGKPSDEASLSEFKLTLSSMTGLAAALCAFPIIRWIPEYVSFTSSSDPVLITTSVPLLDGSMPRRERLLGLSFPEEALAAW
jgi:hypothetical protein